MNTLKEYIDYTISELKGSKYTISYIHIRCIKRASNTSIIGGYITCLLTEKIITTGTYIKIMEKLTE